MMNLNFRKLLTFTLLFVILLVFIQCRQSVSQKDLEGYTKSLNAICPLQVDPYTILEKCELIENNKFKYSYTIINIDIPESDKKNFEEKMKKDIINRVKNDEELKKFRNAGVIFEYSYKKTDSISYEFTITENDYK